MSSVEWRFAPVIFSAAPVTTHWWLPPQDEAGQDAHTFVSLLKEHTMGCRDSSVCGESRDTDDISCVCGLG